MSSSMEATLLQAAVSTFEQLGFLFTDPEPSEEQAAVKFALRSRVGFAGPMHGHLVLRMSGDVVGVLAENMMGGDAIDDPELERDAFGELTNVVCGNLLPALAGERAVFDLEAPDVRAVEHDSGPEPTAVVTVGVEEGRAEVALYLEDEIDEGAGT